MVGGGKLDNTKLKKRQIQNSESSTDKKAAGDAAPKATAAKVTTTNKNSRLVITAVYCFSYVACETLPPMFGPASTKLSLKTGLSSDSLTQMPSLLSLGSVVGGLCAGVVMDWPSVAVSAVRANVVMIAALVACAFCSGTQPLVSSLAAMAGLNTALGFFNGMFRASANTMILRVHGDHAAPYMQALHLSGGLGRLLAPMSLRVLDLVQVIQLVMILPRISYLLSHLQQK